MKLSVKLTNKEIVSALGNGVRQYELSVGNGGFRRKTNVHKPKNLYKRKPKNNKITI